MCVTELVFVCFASTSRVSEAAAAGPIQPSQASLAANLPGCCEDLRVCPEYRIVCVMCVAPVGKQPERTISIALGAPEEEML